MSVFHLFEIIKEDLKYLFCTPSHIRRLNTILHPFADKKPQYQSFTPSQIRRLDTDLHSFTKIPKYFSEPSQAQQKKNVSELMEDKEQSASQ